MQTTSKTLTLIQPNQAQTTHERYTDSAQKNKSALSSILKDAESVADLILQEIMLRWPGQTKSWDISKMKKAWGRGMAEAGVIDNRRMGAALSQLTDKRFPPDLGALLSTATQPVNESMAEAALNKIYKVITSPYTPLYLLTREEYYCIKKIDVWELKHAPNGRLNLILKIQDILNYAINHPNILPDVPPKPAGTIEQKPNTTVIEAKKKEMFDILGIKKLPLPAK